MENSITDKITDELSLDEIAREVEAAVQNEQTQYGGANTVIPITPATNDTLTALRENEKGDARLFINLQRQRFCFDHSLEKWFKWNGHFWEEDAIGHVYSALDSVVDKYSAEYDRQAWKRKSAVLSQNADDAKKAADLEKELLRRMFELQAVYRQHHVLFFAGTGENTLGISGDEWDKNPFLLGCKNGVVDLKTGEFSSGNPEDYIRMASPTEWKGISEPRPQWENFLKGMFDGSADLVEYTQRLLGYGITGSTKDHILAVFWGPRGRNGKGTLFETLKYVLGPIVKPINVEMLTGDQRNRSSAAPSPDIMSLRGCRLVWASEAEDGHQFAIGKIKWLTGADTLTGRPPFGKKNITFSPTHKIFLITNKRPQLSSIDQAFLERLHLIPLSLKFIDNPQESFERKRDPDLPEKLKTEASGILAWLVRGCLEWQEHGLQPPTIILDTTAQYQADEDIVGQFLSDCTRKEVNGVARAQLLYNTYKTWCENCGYRYSGIKEFGRRMKEQQYEKGADSRGNLYKGLCLIVHSQQENDGGADYA